MDRFKFGILEDVIQSDWGECVSQSEGARLRRR